MKKSFIILSIVFVSFIQVWGQDSVDDLDALYELRERVGDRERANIDLEIAKHYYETNLDSLEVYIERLSKDMNVNQDKVTAAYLEKFRSLRYSEEMILDSSNLYLSNALGLFRELDRYDEMGEIASTIGGNYLLLGNHAIATEMFLQSLAYFESIEDRAGIARVYNDLGRISFRSENFDQAMDYFNSSLSIFEELSNMEKIFSLYNNIGITHYNLGNFSEALEMFTKSKKGFEASNDLIKIATVGSNIALCYTEMGQIDLAIEQLSDAMQISVTNSDELGINNTLVNMAYCNRLAERYDSSIVQLERALSMSITFEFKGLESEIYSEYSELHRSLGNYKEAFDFRVKYDSLKEIVRDKDAQKRIEGLQVSFEHQIREQELVQLRADRKMQTRINNIFLLVAILTFILLLILVYGSMMNKRNSKLLEDKNKLLKDYNDRLIESADSLKELIEDKNRLFSIVAHDIRNPIAAVEGFSELLLENYEKLDHDTRKDYILQIQHGASSTGELLENMLLWARSQMNKVNMDKREVQVSKIISDGIAPVLSSLESKSLELRIDILPNLMVMVDVEMIKAVVRNLVTNAVKFSFPGKVIEIDAYVEDRNVHICISDKGVGMTNEMIDNLFSPQFSKSTTGTAGESGSGLGLLICKDYVEKNGGQIKVSSAPGMGSKFTMLFPIE